MSATPREGVRLAHGGGGRLATDLSRALFAELLGLAASPEEVVFTTDAFVVSPLEFPGGDIGSLAVNGAVNDLAARGAVPQSLAAALIVEEGLDLELLRRIAGSMRAAADRAGVRFVTGELKVVDRGKGDGLFVVVSGIGARRDDAPSGVAAVLPGDRIVINGDIGRHGVAILAAREGIAFGAAIASDTTPLAAVIDRLFKAGVRPRLMRDLTCGGLAGRLQEIACSTRRRLEIDDEALPVDPRVREACEFLGLDARYLIGAGRFVAVVAAGDATPTIAVLREDETGAGAVEIGRVVDEREPLVVGRDADGEQRIWPRISGERPPRTA